jgi:hypothetical protein
MTTFNWTITKLHIHPTQNNFNQVVYAVSWKCEGTDDNFSPPFVAFTEGDEAVDLVNDSGFTDYNQLTENQVWDWINSKIDKQEIETNLQIRIDNLGNEREKQIMLNPELPWLSGS